MASSAMSNRSSAASSYMSGASKKTFDRDDIEKLSAQLNKNLLPIERYSRLASGGRANSDAGMSSKASVASVATQRTLASIHEQPWKPY